MNDSKFPWRLAGVVLATVLMASTAQARTTFLYAGSYTSGTSKGIYAWRFDEKTGALAPLGLVAQSSQPAHIWIAPNGKSLYAVNWEQEAEGGVSAFGINRSTGQLTFLNRVSSKGVRPNQVVLDPRGRIAVTVNYASGTMAAFELAKDGKLSDAFYVDQHKSADSSVQPKAHGVEFTKDGRLMYVAELGLDRVYVYRVDTDKPSIVPADPPFVSTHAGSGPRRLQLSRDERYLYVNHELDSEVSVFAVQGETLTEIQTLSTLPTDAAVKNTTAEIMIDSAGRHLYVSNRGHDSVAVFDIDSKTGKLERRANVSVGGKTPRNIRLDPTGKYLLCANEGSGSINVFKVDRSTGMLTATSESAAIDTPGGMYFLEVN